MLFMDWIWDRLSNSLLSKYYNKTEHPLRKPDYKTKKDFWDQWWNRNLQTVNGIDGWEAQATFLMEMVKFVNGRISTFGFELLNEPAVFSVSHYPKIRTYYDYLIDNLRKITNKPIVFCWAAPHGLVDTPVLQAMASPTDKKNIVFDCHPYPPSYAYILYFKLMAMLIGKNVPLYIGEFNSGIKFGSTLSQNQMSSYAKRLSLLGARGWALWRWSYIQDHNIPAFNLTRVQGDRIEPNESFKHVIALLNNA